MITLDTCALIFDALAPEKLTTDAKKAIARADKQSQLFCSDISLWEIGMLIEKGRLNPGVDTHTFLQTILQARPIEVLPITPEIAVLATTLKNCSHYDPADRIIAATAISHKTTLITYDRKLKQFSSLSVIW
jgi:PIN domain nuclease of toxin-antitoxin system